MAYSKLHSSIVNSSLWTEPDAVRILFITLLAACDKEGVVYGSRNGLSRLANIGQDDEDDAWDALLSPDPDSSDKMRCPENQGRRIEEVPGGFRLLNFAYYRGLRDDDDRRKQNREAQARFRSKSAKLSRNKPASASVSPPKPISEAEADGTTNKQRPRDLQEVLGAAAMVGCPPEEAERFWHHFEATGWVTKNGQSIAKWQSKLASWAADSRSRKAERAHHTQEGGRAEPSAGAALVRDQKELERVEKKIAEIKNSYEAHHDVSEFDRQTLSKLNARKKELTGKLGFTV